MRDQVKVWDAPTRLFHWLLVALFGAMWWSGEQGQLMLHTRLGIGLLVLLLFRLLWGLWGSETSRFTSFVRGPAAIAAYLRGEQQTHAGHNPLGALMVLAMLAALLLQLCLGLFAVDTDSYLYDGPLARLLDGELAELISDWHGAWFNVLLLLVVVHVLAIVAYRFLRGENLVLPMLTGNKPRVTGMRVPVLRSPWLALLLLMLAGGLVLGGLSLV